MQDTAIRQQIIDVLREGAELRLHMTESAIDVIIQASHALHDCLKSGGKILLFGNGGSAADAQHMAAEFVCRFGRERKPLAAIALTTDSSALTAIGNDYGFERIFSRQIQALCDSGDVAVAISTSGRSPNVLDAVRAARECGATTIALTGASSEGLVELVDIPIMVPSTNTARIQECHITIGHIMCEIVDCLLGI